MSVAQQQVYKNFKLSTSFTDEKLDKTCSPITSRGRINVAFN